MKNKNSKSRNVLFFAVTIIVPLIFFVCIDLFLGLLLLKRDEVRVPHQYYHHDLKPLSETPAKWGDKNYILRTNSLGFKDGSCRKVFPAGDKRKRILFIGDSFTEGLGYEYSETFSGLLGNELKDSVEILNAGVTSYSPRLYNLKIRYLAQSGFEFDELVVMLDISDIQDELIYKDFKPVLSENTGRSIDRTFSNYSFSYHYFFRKLVKKIMDKNNGSIYSEAEIFLEKNIENRAKWTYDSLAFEEWGKNGVELAKRELTDLIQFCKTGKIKISICIYPWPETLLNDNVNSRHVEIWRSFCKDNDIELINLFPFFLTVSSFPE